MKLNNKIFLIQTNMPFDLLAVIKELGKFDIVSGNLIYGLTFFVGEGILLSTITYYFLYEYGATVDLGLILIPAATAGGIILGLRAAASAFLRHWLEKHPIIHQIDGRS